MEEKFISYRKVINGEEDVKLLDVYANNIKLAKTEQEIKINDTILCLIFVREIIICDLIDFKIKKDKAKEKYPTIFNDEMPFTITEEFRGSIKEYIISMSDYLENLYNKNFNTNQQQPVLQESVPANMSVDIDNILNRFIKPMQQQPVQQQPVMMPNQILIDWNNINQQTLDMVTTELKKYVDFNKNNLNQDKITIDVIRSLYTAIIIYGQQLTSRLQTYGMFSYTFMIQEYMPNAIKLKTPNIPNTNNYLEIIIDNNGFVTSCLVKTN